MDAQDAAVAFAALSQERRVRLLDRLVAAGSEGMSAGEIAAALAVAPSTLSFHLAALEDAGLIQSTRRGRQLIYTPRAPGLARLMGAAAALCRGADAGDRVASFHDDRGRTSAFNVLFLCRHNSARSIMAEAALRRIGAGRFAAFSAGPEPASRPSADVLELLRAAGHEIAALRSKSWDELTRPGGASMDFVITLCDMPEGRATPAFGRAPVTALWLLPDPTRFEGSARERTALLTELYGGVRRRVEAFCRLPFAALDRAAVQSRVDEIGGTAPAA